MEKMLGGQGSEPAVTLEMAICLLVLFLTLGIGLLSLLYFELLKRCLFRVLFLALVGSDIFGVNAIENFVSAVCEKRMMKKLMLELHFSEKRISVLILSFQG